MEILKSNNAKLKNTNYICKEISKKTQNGKTKSTQYLFIEI